MPRYFFDFREAEQQPSYDSDGLELPWTDAPAYVFFASPNCSGYITGEILPIIGGYQRSRELSGRAVQL